MVIIPDVLVEFLTYNRLGGGKPVYYTWVEWSYYGQRSTLVILRSYASIYQEISFPESQFTPGVVSSRASRAAPSERLSIVSYIRGLFFFVRVSTKLIRIERGSIHSRATFFSSLNCICCVGLPRLLFGSQSIISYSIPGHVSLSVGAGV